jgi:hypothetical protein
MNRSWNIEAYSYHSNSRFGSRVKIQVENDIISVTGPRMSVSIFRVWLAIQGLLLTFSIIFVITGILFLSLRYILLSLGLFALHVWGCMGGTAVWELFNLLGHETATFRVDEVEKFNRGMEWAKGINRLLIPFYVLTMNRISPGYIISFMAPDKKTGKNVVYALMLWNEEDALILESLLAKEYIE